MIDNRYITITKDDPAYPFLQVVSNRKNNDVIKTAAALFDLLHTLHKTSTQNRPPLNGSSRFVISENIGISKGLISQYLTVHKKIQSQKVKQEIISNHIGILKAYPLSKIRGKNQEETEKLQLQKIEMLKSAREKQMS